MPVPRALALVLCLISLARCTCEAPPGPGARCSVEVPCADDEVCGADGLCRPVPEPIACDVDAGESACAEVCCAADQVCSDGACVTVVLPCAAGESECGALCCTDGATSCVRDTCVDDALLGPCSGDDDCQSDTFCDEASGRCQPFDLPGGPGSDEQCTVLVALGVFNPSIQCEWQPEDSRTPCTLAVTGNPDYPYGLTAPECLGREVCVDEDVTDAELGRVCIDPHRQILATPMVVKFRFPAGSAGNPDGTALERPSLVFPSYDGTDGGAASGTIHGLLRVVDGQSCRTLYTIDGLDPLTGLALFTMGASPVALGDIDRAADLRPEIVAHAQGGGLWSFKYDEATDAFAVLWHSKNADGSLNQHNRGTATTNATFGFEVFSTQHWSGPAIHDLDDDGAPESLMSGSVFDAQGTVLFEADDAFEAGLRFIATGQFAAVADVDLDGSPELVTGDQVFDWVSPGPGQPGSWVPSAAFVADAAGFDGYVAIGDLGDFDRRDGTSDPGFPEIVVVNNNGGGVFVQTSDGQIVFGPIPVPGGGVGGPPTIGDFDGDGAAEFAEAGGRAYTIFDFACAVDAPQLCDATTACAAGFTCPVPGRCSRSSTPCEDFAAAVDCPSGEQCVQLSATRECVPDGCQGNGIRWSQVSQDVSSNRTGSSVFDFEGDGEVEAVYADECYTRIYRGEDGVVLFSQFHSSCTWYENAIVVDVDGDLRSEIVVGSNENCGSAQTCFNNAFVADPGIDAIAGTADDVRVDPIFPGLRCASGADCASGSCVDELCRCSADSECGGGDFVCAATLPGSTTVLDQLVCRAAFRVDSADGRPGITGVRVYRDALDRWVGSRPVWNQHTYSVTNVDDNGGIPRTSDVDNNWDVAGLNNYRQNVQGGLDANAFPDLTGGNGGAEDCIFNDDGTQSLPLRTRICNRGTLDVAGGVPVAFYRGAAADPLALACVVSTTQQLAPGACEEVTCLVNPAPILTPTDFLVVVDDDGTGSGERAECHEGNNRTLLLAQTCFSPGG